MDNKKQEIPVQHEDFGEKIGGARKDLWKERGLYTEDLETMNEREAERFVRKENIWKRPDSLVLSGIQQHGSEEQTGKEGCFCRKNRRSLWRNAGWKNPSMKRPQGLTLPCRPGFWNRIFAYEACSIIPLQR